MIVTTTECVPGKKVTEVLGVVKGSTIRAKHLGKDIATGLKSLIGGELGFYTQMLNEARDQAIQRMVEDAKKLKADAVINVRLTTSMVVANAAEVMAYGTAVKLGK
ncbi:MAG: YbjQ family protein [Candidatus Aenigmatarchaeota archaeon]